ncbi:Aldehyde dehydrogenase [Colletotrichum gloeosporioides]|uniref:aldehyde dehydrogenase (NAD(+)) n=1 Tax=Colletotrichum gloeosporioides TaxID=474922 RepID=A0A8H4CN46_COLGL|nr:Aldehyde dehydrogenase [Colletotrichum gloeosporioides]KAF3806797.1 Aldehyde dehydrogenase [Colletotrichum gloeosporioides]
MLLGWEPEGDNEALVTIGEAFKIHGLINLSISKRNALLTDSSDMDDFLSTQHIDPTLLMASILAPPPGSSTEFHTEEDPSVREEKIRKQAVQVVRSLTSIPPTHSGTNLQAITLLTAGSELKAEDYEDHELVSQRFRALYSINHIRSNLRALDLLLELWELRDAGTEITTPNDVIYMQPLGLFINNKWVAAKSGEEITVISPIDEIQTTKVHAGGADDIDVAVKAARAALEGPWAGVSARDRGKLMLRLADLAEQHTKTLVSIDTWKSADYGRKRFSSACGDAGELTDVLRYYAGFADKLHGQVIDTTDKNFAYTSREPLGVCGQTIPWNYALGMAGGKIAPALAASGTITWRRPCVTRGRGGRFRVLTEKRNYSR